MVDDEAIIRYQLQTVLKDVDADLFAFSSGEEAYEFLEKNNDVAMVITDWVMPGMDGFELILRIKAMENQKFTYIVLLTNINDKDCLAMGMSYGADDFIQKPIEEKEVFARVYAGLRMQQLQNELRETNDELRVALQRMKVDLIAAAELHKTILPDPELNVESVEITSLFQPCEYIGGDLYGYRDLNEDLFAFYQIDVSGHGVPSALFSFALGNELLKQGNDTDWLLEPKTLEVREVHDTVRSINDSEALNNLNSDLYFTMIYVQLNRKTGHVNFCQAGHPHLIHFKHQDNACTIVGEGGFPVGLIKDADYQKQSFQMQKYDRIFMFSDGLPEALSSSDEMYGDERLCRLIQENSHLTLNNLLEYLYQTVVNWTESKKLDDDVTITAIQWNGEGEHYEFHQ